MQYRQLGNSGVRVSVIGIGTNRFGSELLPQKEVGNIIDFSIEMGINHIDTSNSYQEGRSEEALGEALKRRRQQFVVATKFWFPVGNGPNDRGASRYHIMTAVESSLRRLQTDHIDLYYVHRWDERTPIDETLRTLDDLVRVGKVRYVGVSDFASWQLAHANLLATLRGWTPIAVIQAEYNLLERSVEREVLPYCRAHNVGFVPYYPLSGGFLTGKYKRGRPVPPGSRGESNVKVQRYLTAPYYSIVEQLEEWAADRGRGLNELAQAWLLAQPQICSVISGATRLEHVIDNVKAADWGLTGEEVAEINMMVAHSV